MSTDIYNYWTEAGDQTNAIQFSVKKDQSSKKKKGKFMSKIKSENNEKSKASKSSEKVS